MIYKKRFFFIIIIALNFILTTCSKENEEEREYPRVNTLEVKEISQNGATFEANIYAEGSEGIIDHGFVWGTNDVFLSVENSDRISLGAFSGIGKYDVQIQSTLQLEKKYFVRSFVRTLNHTVYGSVVSFISLGSKGPQIIDFDPKTATSCDTLKIQGRYFSHISTNNKVYFGDIAATVIQSSDSLLKVIVPDVRCDQPVKIKVTEYGNTSTSNNSFSYLKPEISGIYPLSGTFNDTITVTGINLGCCSVTFDNKNAEIIYSNSNQIKVLVPCLLTKRTSDIKVNVSGYSFTYNSFKLNDHIITSYSVDTLKKYNQIFTINGDNFNPIISQNNVVIDNKSVIIMESSRHSLKVYLPNAVIPEYNISAFKNLSVIVKIAELSVSDSIYLAWHSTWTRKKDFPGYARLQASCFSSNNKGYYGTGRNYNNYYNDFWEYDPNSDSWTQIDNLPGQSRSNASSFTINDKSYVGLGQSNTTYLKDFYMLDHSTKKWQSIADYEGNGRACAFSFVINDESYVGTGRTSIYDDYKDVWSYNPILNKWSKQNDFIRTSFKALGFTINQDAYIFDINTIYKMTANGWSAFSTLDNNKGSITAFVINNIFYFGFGISDAVYSNGTNKMWSFNGSNISTFNKTLNFYNNNDIWGQSAFVINNKAYLIGGENGATLLNHVWEFDPTKPEQ